MLYEIAPNKEEITTITNKNLNTDMKVFTIVTK